MIVNGVAAQTMGQDPGPILEEILWNEGFLNLI